MPGEPTIPEPTRRLPARARWAWRLTGAGMAVPVLFGAAVLSGALADEGALLPALTWVLAAVAVVLMVAVVPELRWRRWRYEVRPDEIDYRHGAFTIRRTVVPMARVQHVDTEEGVVQQVLNLATVTFHTAAGENEIPHLEPGEAAEVRDRIAELARSHDDT